MLGMVLAPDMARQEIVQRRNGATPRNVIAHLQPLGMLVQHRINDVNECLIAGEEAVAAGEEIALEPTLALVFAKHLHYPPTRSQMVVPGADISNPGTIGDLEDVLPAVRVVFVGTEEPEIALLHIQLHHVA